MKKFVFIGGPLDGIELLWQEPDSIPVVQLIYLGKYIYQEKENRFVFQGHKAKLQGNAFYNLELDLAFFRKGKS